MQNTACVLGKRGLGTCGGSNRFLLFKGIGLGYAAVGLKRGNLTVLIDVGNAFKLFLIEGEKLGEKLITLEGM
jgi:hypothetical protein